MHHSQIAPNALPFLQLSQKPAPQFDNVHVMREPVENREEPVHVSIKITFLLPVLKNRPRSNNLLNTYVILHYSGDLLFDIAM